MGTQALFMNIIQIVLQTRYISLRETIQVYPMSIHILLTNTSGEVLLHLIDSLLTHCSDLTNDILVQMIHFFISNDGKFTMEDFFLYHKEHEKLATVNELQTFFQLLSSLLLDNNAERCMNTMEYMAMVLDTFSHVFFQHNLFDKDKLLSYLEEEKEVLKSFFEIKSFLKNERVQCRKRKLSAGNQDHDYSIEFLSF